MDDHAYRAAVERRQRLLEELDKLNKFIELHQVLFSDGGKQTSARPEKRSRNPVSPAEVATIAREIILQKGRPMTRGELVPELESRGVEIVAKDKAKNVGTTLWRAKGKFNHVEGHGYWPSDMPLPPGYHQP